MSTVAVNTKNGHPVAGIVLGIVGITVALLMTLLFGVIAGGVAAALGIGALLLGISARKGATIVVTVSMGSAERELPIIAGQSVETAVRALNAQGFVASGVYVSSDTVEAGKVIGYTSHTAGDKERYGSTVVINISTGPEP